MGEGRACPVERSGARGEGCVSASRQERRQRRRRLRPDSRLSQVHQGSKVRGRINVSSQPKVRLHPREGARRQPRPEMAIDAGWAEGGRDDVWRSQQQGIGAIAVTAGGDDHRAFGVARRGHQRRHVATGDRRHVPRQDEHRGRAAPARRSDRGRDRRVHVAVAGIVKDERACPQHNVAGGLIDHRQGARENIACLHADINHVAEHRQRQRSALRRAERASQTTFRAVADARDDHGPDPIRHCVQSTQQLFGRLNSAMRRIVALAGGVGGSRFARGLRAAAPDAELTVVVNTGDDVTLHGLRISPDVDTVLYALAGLVDEHRGWGPRGDTFRCMDALERLGGETWFRLGDVDLAIHLRRTELLAAGWAPSRVTAELADRFGIAGVRILPMTDAPVETWVKVKGRDGGEWVHFQEYFVHRRTDVAISAVQVRGVEHARAAPGVIESFDSADVIVFCPSNPFVSIGPILAIRGVREAIARARSRGTCVAAVSPLIGGATVKGPAARMLSELGYAPTAAGVLDVYAGLVDVYLIDRVDAGLSDEVARRGARPVVTDALMRGRRGEARLARVLLKAVSRG